MKVCGRDAKSAVALAAERVVDVDVEGSRENLRRHRLEFMDGGENAINHFSAPIF
jgi:hypothetical protein